MVSGILSQQSNTCDPILNNCDYDGSSTINLNTVQNTSSIVSNTTKQLALRADETTNGPPSIYGNETFDVYLARYLIENPNAEVENSEGFPNPYPSDVDSKIK